MSGSNKRVRTSSLQAVGDVYAWYGFNHCNILAFDESLADRAVLQVADEMPLTIIGQCFTFCTKLRRVKLTEFSLPPASVHTSSGATGGVHITCPAVYACKIAALALLMDTAMSSTCVCFCVDAAIADAILSRTACSERGIVDFSIALPIELTPH